METMNQLAREYPDKITHAQFNALNSYLESHPRMEVRSVTWDCLMNCVMVYFASGLICGIEPDGHMYS